MPLIYLDYNASTPIDPTVASAIRPEIEQVDAQRLVERIIGKGQRFAAGKRRPSEQL